MIIKFRFIDNETFRIFHNISSHFELDRSMGNFYKYISKEIPDTFRYETTLKQLNYVLKEIIIASNRDVWDKYYKGTEITEDDLLDYSLEFSKLKLERDTGIAYLSFLLFMMLPDRTDKELVNINYANEVLSIEVEDKNRIERS